ncbi:MAG: hypothetical protein J0L58_16740 [Burkholderiales bacterium]|nr:hypothetical protein [Burkholderiales bacterium]
MSEGAAFIVREILESGGQPGRPFQQQSRRLAFKTGTSFGFRDAWALGVTDRFTLGVWVGRPDGTPNPGHFGANTAAPLLHELLALLPNDPALPRAVPTAVSQAAICWPLGLAEAQTAPLYCQQRRTAWLLQHSSPPTLPDRLDPSPLLQASPCGERLRWPLALSSWVNQPQPCGAEVASGAWQLQGLEPAQRLQALPGQRAVHLEARTQGGQGPRWWLLDGRLVAQSEAGDSVRLSLEAGTHRLTVLDAQGRFEHREFSVSPHSPR